MTDEPHPTSTPTPAEHWDVTGAATPGYAATAALIVVDMQKRPPASAGGEAGAGA